MILLDGNATLIANVFSLAKLNDGKFDDKLYKHKMFNSILSFKKKFSDEYGNLIICFDAPSNTYWRKDIFPHYKVKRATARKAQQDSYTDIVWQEVYDTINEIKSDLYNIFPYRVMEIEGAEADDIIGYICSSMTTEKIMIISRDHDFQQLTKFSHVKQFDPVAKKIMTMKNPQEYLKEHIIRGDKGDNIPNILSAEDCIVNKVKQKGVSTAKLQKWLKLDYTEFCEDENMIERWKLNEKLIDLTKIPDHIEEKIYTELQKPILGDNNSIHSYLIKNKLVKLASEYNLFMEN